MSQRDWEHVESYKKEIINDDAIVITWSIMDVYQQGKNNGHTLNDAECRKVLGIVGRQHDACHGINWETIDAAIDEHIANKLKPCPFCGKEDSLYYVDAADESDTDSGHAVRCNATNGGCGATGGYQKTVLGALKTWNNRGES